MSLGYRVWGQIQVGGGGWFVRGVSGTKVLITPNIGRAVVGTTPLAEKFGCQGGIFDLRCSFPPP